MNISKVRSSLKDIQAEKRVLTKALKSEQKQCGIYIKELKEIEVLQKLFQTAIKTLYKTLSNRLGDIVTEGLSIVFPDSGYLFKIAFEDKRGSVEARIYFEDPDGDELDPKYDVGGGILDLTSLLLRIIYIMLSEFDNILIADEPLKFVDKEALPDAVEFIHKVCKDLKFQMLCVSHLIEMADKSEAVYKVTKQGSTSKIKKIFTK